MLLRKKFSAHNCVFYQQKPNIECSAYPIAVQEASTRSLFLPVSLGQLEQSLQLTLLLGQDRYAHKPRAGSTAKA